MWLKTSKSYLVIAIVFTVLMGLTGCAKDLITGKKTLNYYSIKDEPRLGKYVLKYQLKALKKSKKKYDSKKNKKQLKLIRNIVDDIAAVSHYPKFPYEIHLADIPIVNAWCAPGGKMMVYEGLWDPKKGLVKKGNKDELAAVMAHEIAHATARHVTESISRNLTILTIAQVAASIISSQSSEGGNIFQQIFTQGFNVFIPTYSRKNEFEADRVGFFYMARAGYDPRAAIRLWKRAAKKKGNRSSLYSTHPSSGARYRALEKLLPDAMLLYEEAKRGKKRR